MPPVEFSTLSERGLRDRNDDAFCAEKVGDFYLFAVAGGLAGHPYGDIASRAAINALRDAVKGTSAREILLAGVRSADAEVKALTRQSPAHTGLAVNLAACLVSARMECTVLDATGKNCLVITESLAENAQKTAKLRHLPGSRTAPFVSSSPPSLTDMIGHVLGEPHRLKDADFAEFILGKEFLLVASGGLTDYLTKEVIATIVRQNRDSLDAAAEALVQEAMKAGSERTITVVLARPKGKA
jgi:protein phosphatase